MTVFLFLVCVGIIALVLKGPVTRLVESRRELAATEASLAEEEEMTRSLEERKARDLSDRYVETEARKMGYVKPGEIPIVVLDTSGKENSEGEGEEAPANDPGESRPTAP